MLELLSNDEPYINGNGAILAEFVDVTGCRAHADRNARSE